MTKVRAALFLMFVISSLSGCQFEQKEFFETAKPEFAEQRLYSYMYWENGLPTTTAHRIPSQWITPQMVENPDLVIQTGFYNLRFDADDMTFTGFDLSKGGGYLNALKQEVKFTQSAKLNVAIVANGVTYTADRKGGSNEHRGTAGQQTY